MSKTQQLLRSLKLEIRGRCVIPSDDGEEYDVVPAHSTKGKIPDFWGIYIRQGALLMHVRDYTKYNDAVRSIQAMRAVLNTLMWWSEEIEG